MFKRLVVTLLAFTLIASLCSCDARPNPSPGDSATSTTTVGNNAQTDTTETINTDKDITPENWGSAERWVAGKTAESKPFYINFPKYVGYTEGYGLVAEQTDDTMVIVAAEFDNSPSVDALKNFLPAYFEDIQYTLEKIYGMLSSNYQFKVNSDKTMTIGEYEMHSFNGLFSFDKNEVRNEYQFVVYATQLKSNGAYAYWVVYDTSIDQSNGDLIAEHALNMAKTFREEE